MSFKKLTLKEVFLRESFKAGDEVYWNDPDKGTRSGYYLIGQQKDHNTFILTKIVDGRKVGVRARLSDMVYQYSGF